MSIERYKHRVEERIVLCQAPVNKSLRFTCNSHSHTKIEPVDSFKASPANTGSDKDLHADPPTTTDSVHVPDSKTVCEVVHPVEFPPPHPLPPEQFRVVYEPLRYGSPLSILYRLFELSYPLPQEVAKIRWNHSGI